MYLFLAILVAAACYKILVPVSLCFVTAEKGGFFPPWKQDTAKYVEPITPSVKAWLRKLKAAGKKLFLMSSSYVDYATTSMRHISGYV